MFHLPSLQSIPHLPGSQLDLRLPKLATVVHRRFYHLDSMVQVNRPSSHKLQLPLGLDHLGLDLQREPLHCHRASNSPDMQAVDDS